MQPRLLALVAGAFFLVAAPSSFAAPWTWMGGAGTATWDTDGQWDAAGFPPFDDTGAGPHGQDLVFPASSASSTVNLRNVNAKDAVLSLLFDAGGPAYRFQRSAFPTQPIDLWGNLTNNSDVMQTFASGMALEGAIVVSGAHGDPATSYAFDFGDHLWVGGGPTYNGSFSAHVTGTGPSALQGSGNLTINDAGIVVEGGLDASLSKYGNGTLVLNGASSTTRVLTIREGLVRVANSSALGLSSSTRNTVLSGGTTGSGTLQLSNHVSVGEYLGFEGRDGAAGTAVALQNADSANTFTGPLSLQGNGSRYNFGSLAGKLTVTSNVVFPASLSGGRYLTFRGPGDGEFSGFVGANNVGLDPHLPGHVSIMHWGSGTLTFSGADNWRIGHVMSLGGGTLKFAATFANIEANQTDYSLFAPMDDLTVQNVTRFVLLNGSSFDFSVLTSTGGSNIGLVGGGLLLNRILAGSGTVLGNVKAASTGSPALKPGNGVAWNPADPSGATLDPSGAFTPGVGTLTFANDLDLSAAPADYEWHLSGLVDQADGVAGADWDLIQVHGQTTLSDTDTLSLSFVLTPGGGPSGTDTFWSHAHTWKILDTVTHGSGSTNFGTIRVFGPTFDSGTFSVSLGSGPDEGDVFLNWTLGRPLNRISDIDGDGDVDKGDYALMVNCFQGPRVLFVAGCENCDLDHDGDVDQLDLGIWQACFSGANKQALVPQCTQTTIPPPPP